METTQIAIIGGGFSGISTALHWLRFHGIHQQIELFESRAQLGEGVAYQSQSLQHLLNLPADQMGLFFDDPKGFSFWLQERGYLQYQAHDFVPRILYGDYLKDYIAYFKDRFPNFKTNHDEVVSIHPQSDHYVIETSSGRKVAAQVVIGTFGNLPKKLPIETEAPQIESICGSTLGAKYPPGSRFAILGSGLSMIDFVMDTFAQNPTAQFWSLSRHGSQPYSHETSDSTVQDSTDFGGTAGEILRQLRNWKSANPSQSWTRALEILELQSPRIWKSWTLKQKSQFQRHLRSRWESFSQRAAPSIALEIEHLKSRGQLEIHAGHLEAIFHQEILWRPRGESRLRAKKFDFLVTALGLETNLALSPRALQRQLFRDGLCVPDALRLGIQTDLKGRPIDAQGSALKNFYIIGAGLKPLSGLSPSVPEIREQIFSLVQGLTQRPQIQVDSNL